MQPFERNERFLLRDAADIVIDAEDVSLNHLPDFGYFLSMRYVDETGKTVMVAGGVSVSFIRQLIATVNGELQ